MTPRSYIIEGLAVFLATQASQEAGAKDAGADWPPHALGSCMHWHCQFMNMRGLEVRSIPGSVGAWTVGVPEGMSQGAI